MIERIFKSWKSSVVGLILFISGIALVGFEKATLTEAGAFFGMAFVLFFTKEKINE